MSSSFFFQAEDGIRDLVRSRGLGDVYKRQALQSALDGCDRATRLVEQLLTLSRLEAHAAPPASVLDLSLIHI